MLILKLVDLSKVGKNCIRNSWNFKLGVLSRASHVVFVEIMCLVEVESNYFMLYYVS